LSRQPKARVKQEAIRCVGVVLSESSTKKTNEGVPPQWALFRGDLACVAGSGKKQKRDKETCDQGFMELMVALRWRTSCIMGLK
jgi:hypothetical protein